MARYQGGFLVDTWSVEDILVIAEEIEVSLTEAEADAVLHIGANHYDCDTGLNWGYLKECIIYYKEKVK
jgi:hypothetical protein